MKTDAWFYEVFSRFPDLLFRLAGLPYEGHWRFESVTVKTTEKRVDGLLLRVDQPDVYVFAEFQGYDDPSLYWRLYREIATWYESHPKDQRAFLALVLFLDRSHDPGSVGLEPQAPSRLLKLFLEDCLAKVESNPGPLVIFRPLVVVDVQAARLEAPAWRQEIETLNIPPADVIFLKEHLTTLLMGRFRELSQKEIDIMLQLTPLRETRAGREMIEGGRREGQLLLLERLLGLPQSSTEALELLSPEAIEARVAELERQLVTQRRMS